MPGGDAEGTRTFAAVAVDVSGTLNAQKRRSFQTGAMVTHE
jgi:hypothetical protein